MLTVVTKPINCFSPDSGNLRKEFPEEELRLLGESLRKMRLVPGIARKNGELRHESENQACHAL